MKRSLIPVTNEGDNLRNIFRVFCASVINFIYIC